MKAKAAIAGLTVLAAIACTPFETTAYAHGLFKVHSFHFGKHFRSARHNKNFNQWQWYNQWPMYGGLYAIPPYDFYNSGNYAQPGPVVFVSQPPSALSCQHTQEVKTVPSESGGTRNITITRC
jgi:hypothetical protein